MTFYGEPVRREVYDNIHESPSAMTAPLVTLATLSFFLFFTLPYFNPFSDHGWFTVLIDSRDSVVPGHLNLTAHEIAEGMHHAHTPAMLLSILIAFSGIGLAVLMYLQKRISADDIAAKLSLPYKLSLNKFFVDETYQRYLINPSLILARMIAFFDWEIYDKYIVNGFGKVTEWFSRVVGIRWDYDILDQQIVDGVGRTTGFFSARLRLIQTGKVQNYLVWVLAGVIMIYVFQAI
jgi:NADH-quinone oxidoreductase subunit L